MTTRTLIDHLRLITTAALLLLALAFAASAAACVPPDDALDLGGVQFRFYVSQRTTDGIIADEAKGYAVRFDRIALSLKTMTVGNKTATDVCAFRSKPVKDVVFDPRAGFVQSFNGIEPAECTDVGILFGAPTERTTLGNGVTGADIVDLASGKLAHGLVEATATPTPTTPTPTPAGRQRSLRIIIRLDSERTSTAFSGCREARKGVLILPEQREDIIVRFAAENFFRESISTTADLSVRPFAQADLEGNNDGTVTIDEMDALPLTRVSSAEHRYVLLDSTRDGSFGDYVRELFRFTVMFRSEEGICFGKRPGAAADE